jgi:hypothetical protein
MPPIKKLSAIGADGIVICADDGKFYVVTEKQWRDQPLDSNNSGEAGVLVKRGAVMARIPQEGPPVGYACILINLSSLKPAPKKKKKDNK